MKQTIHPVLSDHSISPPAQGTHDGLGGELIGQASVIGSGADNERCLCLALALLRKFVRLFIGRMSFDVMSQLLSQALVEEACRRVVQAQEGKLVLSRVALLTGVRTQRVKDLTQLSQPYYSEGLTTEAIILSRWARDPRYQQKERQGPVMLLIHGAGLTFQRLVALVAGRGVTTQTVVERLVTAGNVRIVNDHWLELVNPHWRPDPAEQERAWLGVAANWDAQFSVALSTMGLLEAGG